MIGIYKITNLLNQKVYIGQSTDIKKRWKKHCITVDNCAIHRAIQKYGVDNFSFEILEECEPSLLNEREIYYIKKYNSYYDGYNMTLGGEGASHPVKLSDIQVDEIKKMLRDSKISLCKIANFFSVSRNTISDINLGKSRKKDGENYPLRDNKFESNIPEKEEFDKLLKDTNGDFCQIAFFYGVTEITVRNWCKKYNFSTRRKDYGFIDEQPYHSKAVVCYDKNWNIIAEYSSLRKSSDCNWEKICWGISQSTKRWQMGIFRILLEI